jgi:pimeloyl-ACP methyl ester carboxylesterase
MLWKRTLEHLSGPKTARAVNLPGHPGGGVVCRTVGEYSEAVHGLVSESNLAPVTVCGHSMGGAIVLTLAIHHPEDVRALVIVDGGAKLGVSPAILKGLADSPLKTIEELITPMSFHSVTLELGREARATLSLSNPKIFLNDYLACDGFDVRDKLAGISARTLIICGESDRMTPPKYSQYLGAIMPNSSVSLVPGAGHMVPLEKPAVLGALIQSFLSEVSR